MKVKEYLQFFSSRFTQAFFVWKEVVRIIWAVNKRYLLIMLGVNVLLGVSVLPAIIVERNIIDLIVNNVGNPAWQGIMSFLFFLIFLRVGLTFFQTSLRRILNFLESSLARLFAARLEVIIGQKMTQLDMAAIETPKFKDRFDKVQRESSRRAWNLAQPVGVVINDISGLISAFLLLAAFKPEVAVAIFFLSLPIFFVNAKFIKEDYQLVTWASPRRRLWGWVASYLIRARNFFEVKLLGLADYLTKKLEKIQKEILDAQISLRRKRQTSRILAIIPLNLFLLGFNFYLAIQAIITKISVGSVEMYIRATTSFQGSLSSFVSSILHLYENYLYIQDLTWLLNLEPKLKYGKKIIDARQAKEIKVENLWFRYEKSGPFVIKDLDFVAKPGETLAIVGENGAGKTTLVKLFCRFYDPNKGKIFLGKTDLQKLTKDNLYQQYSVLFQNFQWFPFTAQESIGFGNVAKISDLKEIKKWARKTRINEYISSLPLKYKNPLARDFVKGIEPSIGQWQRIGLARTLMKQAPIIILDEPTSNVDPKAEEQIFEEIKKLAGRGRILIFISHRFSTVRRADKIYVMERGKFIEQGSHEELMKLDGKYAKLFTAQAKYYR